MQTFFEWMEAKTFLEWLEVVRGEIISKESQTASDLFRARLLVNYSDNDYLKSHPEFVQDLENAMSGMEEKISKLEKKPEAGLELYPRPIKTGILSVEYLKKFIEFLAGNLGRSMADDRTIADLRNKIDEFKLLLVSPARREMPTTKIA